MDALYLLAARCGIVAGLFAEHSYVRGQSVSSLTLWTVIFGMGLTFLHLSIAFQDKAALAPLTRALRLVPLSVHTAIVPGLVCTEGAFTAPSLRVVAGFMAIAWQTSIFDP